MRDNHADRTIASVYVVMGVSAVGKTTIAKAISQKYECLFIEGDDFHSAENVEKMSSGQSLTDQDRLPWLRKLSSAAAVKRKMGCVIMTCSALKSSYRDAIRTDVPDAKFIHLYGGFNYIAKQMSLRKGHFMPTSLLRSQFDTLEWLGEDELGVRISIENGIEAVLLEFEAFMTDNIVLLDGKPA